MTMDELSVAVKAREFVNKVGPTSVPVSVEAYAAHIDAKIKKMDLGDDEDGFSSLGPKGNWGICVNRNQIPERQRFTVCHELAHIVLGLPSEHGSGPSWSYAKRSPNEILCDIFASELLLPHKLFKPLVDKADFSLAEIDRLARDCEASVLATGSRFAAFCSTPCAFVFAEGGKVRYCSRSTTLRAANAWIAPRMELPDGCVCHRIRGGGANDGAEEVDADIWFEDWTRDGVLMEDARHIARYDQTIALLWFEDDDVPPPREQSREREIEEHGLAELDGVLPWPGAKKRRR